MSSPTLQESAGSAVIPVVTAPANKPNSKPDNAHLDMAWPFRRVTRKRGQKFYPRGVGRSRLRRDRNRAAICVGIRSR